MRRLLLLLVLLSGCKANPGAGLTGTWTAGEGSITLADNDKYTAELRGASLTGAWRRSGREVTLTPATYNGKPVAEQAAQLEKSIDRLKPAMRKQAQALVDGVKAPQTLSLSEDSKTLKAAGGAWKGVSLTRKSP